MKQDEIIEMARQTLSKDIDGLWLAGTPDLEAFAKLVAAKRTEKIARYCIWLDDTAGYTDGYDFANAIRVKFQNE